LTEAVAAAAARAFIAVIKRRKLKGILLDAWVLPDKNEIY